MLLNRRRFPLQDDDAIDREVVDVSPKIKNKKIRAKLKDLFVSSRHSRREALKVMKLGKGFESLKRERRAKVVGESDGSGFQVSNRV
ncbi:hypothetical protein Dsin_018848 [Dipteronia sinensis]|uniref:Uncharacterized protein n=1 Tax=Dipteronia sinensis TaxID=43782 RepID=A0AAE0A6M4_9ROSI|nr:hypothetical protein Dsin_018848 [Dipteronia sinensis]